MGIKDEISAAVRSIIKQSALTKSAQSVTGYVAPYWNGNTVRGAAKTTEGLLLGAAGGVGGAVAGAVDGVKEHGFSADAAKHTGRVAMEAAKESARPEAVNRFNGMLGSAVANTAYNFAPGVVGIFSDAGAQKVRDAQDAIGMGKMRQAAGDYNASTQEAQLRRLYGDKGWEDYVQNPEEFAKSHPEVMLSQASETVGRTSLDLAAGFKGFGVAGKAIKPLQKVKGVGQVFKHPLVTGAAVGAASGVKSGIGSESVSQGLKNGLESAGVTTILLGGNPWVGGGGLIGGQTVPVVDKAIDLWNNRLSDDDESNIQGLYKVLDRPDFWKMSSEDFGPLVKWLPEDRRLQAYKARYAGLIANDKFSPNDWSEINRLIRTGEIPREQGNEIRRQFLQRAPWARDYIRNQMSQRR
jgi:hypothetical protein